MRHWFMEQLADLVYDLKNPPRFCFCHFSKRIEMLRLWIIYLMEGERGFGKESE